MAAGLGFKTFTTGEVLTAGDVNGYLMQGVLVFASAAARNSAITSPQEGQFAFTKDTNGLWYYDGAAWVASGATGDIEGVTAGVGISGGGTSGTVTVTNDMATTITAAGDIVVGTGSGTYDNLPIGTTAQVLTADTTVSPYKVKWATPAVSASAMTLIKARTSFSNVASTTTSFDNVFSNTYQNYLIVIDGWTAITAGSTILWQFRSGGTTDANAAYAAGYSNVTWAGTSAPVGPGYGTTSIGMTTSAGAGNFAGLNINYYASRAADTNAKIAYTGYSPQLQGFTFGAGFSNTSTNYDGFILSQSSGNIYTGAVTVYGLAKS